MALDLTGKVAIVTGGSRGIGLAIADALLSHGLRVAIGGRRADHLRQARQWLTMDRGASEDDLEAIPVDVRDPAQAQALVDDTVRRFGGLDVLVNNAGVGIYVEVADQSPDDWREVLDTNLTGVFLCCHAAIPHLRRRGGGWIVNISSLAGKNPFAGGASYCASKAGLNAFSEALMQELRYDDIRVSYILPGSVRTEFAGRSGGEGTEWKLSPEDVATAVIQILAHDQRSLPSRVELRPSKPRK